MGVFRLGDRVEVLDEAIQGRVIEINEDEITMETDDGFPMQFTSDQLVKSGGDIRVSNYEADLVKEHKEAPKRKKTRATKPKERNVPKMEVDLHIHQLTPSIGYRKAST